MDNDKQKQINAINDTVNKINAATASFNKNNGTDLVSLPTLSADTYQQTTTGYREKTMSNIGKFNEMQNNASSGNDSGGKVTNKETTTNNSNSGGDNDFSSDSYMSSIGRQFEADAANQISDITNTFNSIQRYADQAHKDLLASIDKIYSARMEKMKDTNQRLVATKNVTNIRSGRQRYTPQLAAGILTDEEQAGHERLAAIEGAMLAAVAEANQAKAEGDMVRFNNAFANVEKVQERMNKQIEATFKMTLDRERELRLQEKEKRDALRQEFDDQVKRASSVASGLVETLKTLSDEDKATFISLYSEKSGIDSDILLGAITDAASDLDYRQLQIDNIKNQIDDRNRRYNLDVMKENRIAAGSGSSKSSSKEEEGSTRVDISWEDYLNGYQEAVKMSINPNSDIYKELRSEWEELTKEKIKPAKFTDVELKKLEAKGLLNASREEQIQALYGNDDII